MDSYTPMPDGPPEVDTSGSSKNNTPFIIGLLVFVIFIVAAIALYLMYSNQPATPEVIESPSSESDSVEDSFSASLEVFEEMSNRPQTAPVRGTNSDESLQNLIDTLQQQSPTPGDDVDENPVLQTSTQTEAATVNPLP